MAISLLSLSLTIAPSVSCCRVNGSTSVRNWCVLQRNSVIKYPQGKWKKVRTKQSTFYSKHDFPHWQDRFHVFKRTICHGRCFSVLNVVHYSLFVQWNRLSGHRELENVPESWNRNWKVGWHARDHKKKNQRKCKKIAPGGKIGT